MTTENQKPAEKPFDYIAYTVAEVGKHPNKKTYWTRIGVGWFHKNGEGFTARLDALPLNGEIVFRTPLPDNQADQGEQVEATGEEGA
jgi:hypothetical protein